MPLLERLYCSHCDSFRKATAPGANHPLNFAIVAALWGASIATSSPDAPGLFLLGACWVPVWIFKSLKPAWRCSECGSRFVDSTVYPPASPPRWAREAIRSREKS